MPISSYVILDAMGVLFLQEDDLAEVYMPYLEQHAAMPGEGSLKQLIESTYHQLTLGEIDAEQFFSSLRITSPKLDFLLGVTLDPTFSEFTGEVRQSHRLAILSNDSQEWADYRNKRYGLMRLVDYYITSSLLGVRKPSLRALKKTCWLLDASPQACYYVDNLESNLDPAHALGMRPILFRRDGDHHSAYPLVRNFSELNQIIQGGNL